MAQKPVSSRSLGRASSLSASARALGIGPQPIAYQGLAHSFSFLAATKLFSKFPAATITREFGTNCRDIFRAVESKEAKYGVVPIETSTSGTIHSVYDRLLSAMDKVKIVGEVSVIEEYCLCSFAQSDNDIVEIIGHPHMLESCSEYLDSVDARKLAAGQPACIHTAVGDSAAGCALLAKNSANATIAAVASKQAALFYGLNVISPRIGNDVNAQTRYVVIAGVDDQGLIVDPFNIAGGAGLESVYGSAPSLVPKASIAVAMKNVPGAIFRMASCFALRDVDIVKMETRPATTALNIPILCEAMHFSQKHWNLIFYIDYTPSSHRDTNTALIANLKEFGIFVCELGHYSAGLGQVEASFIDWTSMRDTLAIA